jgi:hypothetical protein
MFIQLEKYFYIDDVFLTGFLRQKLNITLVDTNEYQVLEVSAASGRSNFQLLRKAGGLWPPELHFTPPSQSPGGAGGRRRSSPDLDSKIGGFPAKHPSEILEDGTKEMEERRRTAGFLRV